MLAYQELKRLENGLIPVITQAHDTKAVLMQAYMNEEAYNKTIETGLMHYYSRSRSCLWLKGETSGHYQHLVSLYADCDRDCLLAIVRQDGVACHTGAYSCFFEAIIEKENVQ